MTQRFFKRLSSFKVEYEKNVRRTVQRLQSSYRDSSAIFLRDKDEIMKLLRDTLEKEDVLIYFVFV
jgi:CMP-N-acetylneuraminic acid synthetase